MNDAGLYRCVLNTSTHEPVKELDFQLDIVETGLAPNFHENFTYNFTDCCRKEGSFRFSGTSPGSRVVGGGVDGFP